MIAGTGLAIFFDDYANTLLLGGTMRSTADRYGISREKLAYLVDSTAAPVAGLAVVSTWAAIEISYMAEGLKAGGIVETSAAFEMFIQSIPYRFYPWLALAMVFLVSVTGRDFGAMRKVESAVAGKAEKAHSAPSARRRSQQHGDWLWIAAVLPVVLCLIAVAGVLVMTGFRAMAGVLVMRGILSIDGPGAGDGMVRRAGEVLGNGDSYLALIVGGGVGLVVAIVSHLALRGCTASTAMLSAIKGAAQMMPALVILWFAWALSAMTEADKLDTGGYLASLLSSRLDPRLLPTVVFLTAGAIAFSTGTSWGTMGILTPLSISLALQLDSSAGPGGAIVLATCGSVLAGAIFGDHCSPISDTTVLSSRASDCDHVAHVRTQMPYAILVAAVCVVVGTLPAAVGVSPWISLLVGLACLAIFLALVGKRPCETGQVVRSYKRD
jgi:Na+/H+ antiporter NhaC